MSSIKVVDVNNEEAKQEEEPTPQIEEEAKEEPEPTIEEPKIENEVAEQPKEITKEEPKEELENNSKTERYKDKTITCPKCSKSMLLRSYRYKHEKTCQGNIENKPIKPQSKPKPKPKPIVQPVYEEEEEQQPSAKDIKFKIIKPQPANPLPTLQHHYHFLQNEYIKQKQEKYNNLCQNMFKAKPKKR